MIIKYQNKYPVIDQTALIVESANVIGEVIVGAFSSIWFNAVLRGDLNYISVGHHTSIQDGTVVHVTGNIPTLIGDYVTIGHGVILHSCTIGNNSLIGSGANILDNVFIRENVIVAAGTVVTPGTVIPSESMVMGIPGKIIRTLRPDEIKKLKEHAVEYVELMNTYRYE